jgi:hypothetical protein
VVITGIAFVACRGWTARPRRERDALPRPRRRICHVGAVLGRLLPVVAAVEVRLEVLGLSEPQSQVTKRLLPGDALVQLAEREEGATQVREAHDQIDRADQPVSTRVLLDAPLQGPEDMARWTIGGVEPSSHELDGTVQAVGVTGVRHGRGPSQSVVGIHRAPLLDAFGHESTGLD